MDQQSDQSGGTPHDAFFRNTFLNLDRARSLLRGLLPPELVRALDWRTLRLCGGRFSDGRLKLAETDLLFRVRFRRRSNCLYVLVEHKSAPWWRTAYDLLRYAVHFWDRWVDEHPRSRRLPPLLPLVVHHGRRGWTCAGSLQELMDLQSLPRATAALLRQWAEGRTAGKAALLLKLLRQRFGPLPNPLVTRVQRASDKDLDRWGKRLLKAATLRAVFGTTSSRVATASRSRRITAGSR